ncbi:MAG TPA: SDR family oxidoreductase [Candidatus Aquilonibacter sp.]|nr:SDR family oxidoreductase [Candidatus Aquilonibacter sp.]
MELGLRDSVIVVTGGASGIGAAITRACLDEGARVVILSRVSPGVVEFLQELQSKSRPCEFVDIELEDPAACRKATEHISKRYGQLNGLVNNAGVNDGVGLESGSPEQFEGSLRRNLLHCYSLVHYGLPMLKQSRGSIVNIGSKVALTGQGHTSGYAAAKGAILALTREWAAELLPYGIRVNAVMPAEVMTPAYQAWLQTLAKPDEKLAHINAQIPLEHRMTRPEEIASTVVFLLSPTQSSHTTGQQLIVDGGYVHLDRMLTAAPLH